jgi:type I restriction-modification system DNA methylase subunit
MSSAFENLCGAGVNDDAHEGLLEKNGQDAKFGAGQYFTPHSLIGGFQLAAT